MMLERIENEIVNWRKERKRGKDRGARTALLTRFATKSPGV